MSLIAERENSRTALMLAITYPVIPYIYIYP